MQYYQPKLIYKTREAFEYDRDNRLFLSRYISSRVLNANTNFIAAVTGMPGSGKSYFSLSLAEQYSKMTDIDFDVNVHVIHTLKQILELMLETENKKIKFGSMLVFEEPQEQANARKFYDIANQILASLVSTFRNQRLAILYTLPLLSFLDKQTRVLTHAEFKVNGYSTTSRLTDLAPYFIQFNEETGKKYTKKLQIFYPVEDKEHLVKSKLGKCKFPKASKEIIGRYEEIKSKFSREHNEKLYNKVMAIENKENANSFQKKPEDFKTFIEIYQEHGEDLVKIQEAIPYLTPSTFVLWRNLANKHLKKNNE